MTIAYTDDAVTIHHGDALDVLRELPDNSIDAVCTDPPYGLEFMGKDWDAPWQETGINTDAGFTPIGMADGAVRLPRPQWTSSTNPSCSTCGGNRRGRRDGTALRPVCLCADGGRFPNIRAVEMRAFQDWCGLWAAECLRVLKPGGHMLAFGGTRTHHRLTCAIEDAGFEIRDSIAWIYSSGFPKSLNPYRSIMGACRSSGTVPHAVRLSRFIPAPSVAVRAPTALALARTQPEDEPVVLTETGAADGSPVKTVTSLSELSAATNWSTESLWNALSAAVYGQTNTFTTSITTDPIIDAKIWSCLTSQPMVTNTPPNGCRTDGCACPAFTATGTLTGAVQKSHVIRVLTAPALATAQPLKPLAATGTSLKPAHEPIVCARKPLAGTVAGNVAAWGTGALNIDATRVGTAERPGGDANGSSGFVDGYDGGGRVQPTAGRWPANVVLDGAAADELDQQSGNCASSGIYRRTDGMTDTTSGANFRPQRYAGTAMYGDSGGASRFFPVFRYEPKAPTAERPRFKQPGGSDNATTYGRMRKRECNVCGSRTSAAGGEAVGHPWPTCAHNDWKWVEQQSAGDEYAAHPTVKPLDLMRWLVRLITPPGGTVLDCFLGSGTTAEACVVEGFRCIGIERDEGYVRLAVARLSKPIAPVLFGDGLA